MENFAVKSDSFALYEAFKKDVEKIGWKYNEAFTQFTKEDAAETNCLFFANDWDGKPFTCSFSLSNSNDAKSFRLETQYGEALAFAKKVWEQENGFKFGFSGICSASVYATRVSTNTPYPHLVCPYNPAFYDTTHLDLTYGTLVVSNPIVKPTPKFKVGDYLTMRDSKGNKWIGILRRELRLGDYGFSFYAAIDCTDGLNLYERFGFYGENTMSYSSPSEIALLDSKLAEQGKRFDKEKMELVDIPKFQVGDWFIPHKPTGRNEYLAWAMGMDEFENVPQQIREIRLNGNIIAYSSDYAFHPDWCEKTTAPKHKEPIIGELAIFWDSNQCDACVRVFTGKKEDRYREHIGCSWNHAILFESPEQYKTFLKS